MFNYFESIALTEASLKFIKHKQKAQIAGNTFSTQYTVLNSMINYE